MKSEILLTGASGYIGGQLLERLLKKKLSVRVLVRDASAFSAGAPESVELVEGDVRSEENLHEALKGIKTAVYLIHSLGTSPSKFEAQDRIGASNFAKVAKAEGVERIIYLSGLGAGEEKELSAHLRSRQEVGEVLRTSGADVIELRASIILGVGSASYEIIRALVNRLPIMLTPKWVNSLCQPIYIEDVLNYLTAVIDKKDLETEVIEIGGKDQVRYVDLLYECAHQRGKWCKIFTIPVLTPWLSSLWLGLVTPVYARIGRALIEGIKNNTVVHDKRAQELFDIEPIGYREALKKCEEAAKNPSKYSWMSAISAKGFSIKRQLEGKSIHEYSWKGSVYIERPKADVFKMLLDPHTLKRLVYARWLWRVRGGIDRLAGGVGMRETIEKKELVLRDIVDWWRVEEIIPGESIKLLAEMRMPGVAHFTLKVEEAEKGSELFLIADFKAAGLWGRIYWWVTYPFHLILFPKTLSKLKDYVIELR
jgi:uncharacterized protein YbjT (DUF2867 family)